METETQQELEGEGQQMAASFEEEEERVDESDNSTNYLSLHLKKGSRVEVSSEEEGFKGSWFEAKVLEPPVKPKSKLKKRRLTLIEYANLLQDDGVTPLTEMVDCNFIRPPPPLDRLMDVLLELYDVVDAFDRDGWWTGVVAQIDTHSPNHIYMVAFQEPAHVLQFSRQNLRPHWDWNSVGDSWSRPRKLKELPFSLDILNQQATANNPSSLHDCKKEETNSGNLSHPSKKLKAKHYIISEPPLAVLFPSHTRFGQNKCLQQSPSKPNTPIPLLEPGESGSRIRWTSARKKRSSTSNRKRRPSKLRIESDNDSTAGKEQKTKEGAAQPIVVEEDVANGFEFTCSELAGIGPADVCGERLHSTFKIDVTMSSEEDVTAGLVNNLDEHSSSKGLYTPQLMEEPSKLRSKKFHTPEVVEEPRNLHIMNGDPQNDVRDMELVLEVNHPATGNILSVQLPFVKNSPLWEAVDALEIFQKFPQNPHFLPLSDCKEVDREGLAIGRMVTFASTVEKAFKLKISDPIRSFNIHLESLLDLETYGFDIEPFQSCLEGKLAAKIKHEQLQGMSKRAEDQILELISEEKKMEEEIQELESRIKHLKEKIAVINSARERNDGKILETRTCMDVIDELIKKAELDFEEIGGIL